MAIGSGFFNKGRTAIADGTVNLMNDVIRVMLLNNSWTPDPDLDFVSQVLPYEITNTGYTRKTVTNVTITADFQGNLAKIDLDDVPFGAIAPGAIIGKAIYYKRVGPDDSTPSDDILICYQGVPDVPTNGGTITLSISTSGLATLSGLYTLGLKEIASRNIVFATDTIVALLMQDSYVYDPDHQYISDIAASEITVSGYARQQITVFVTEDDIGNVASIDFTNALFPALATGQTIGKIVVAKSTGNDSTSTLIGCTTPTGGAIPTNGSDVLVDWATPAMTF